MLQGVASTPNLGRGRILRRASPFRTFAAQAELIPSFNNKFNRLYHHSVQGQLFDKWRASLWHCHDGLSSKPEL